MTIEEIKSYAKQQCGAELSDEEAEALLGKLREDGVLSEAELEGVSGGMTGDSWKDRVPMKQIVEAMNELKKKQEEREKRSGV